MPDSDSFQKLDDHEISCASVKSQPVALSGAPFPSHLHDRAHQRDLSFRGLVQQSQKLSESYQLVVISPICSGHILCAVESIGYGRSVAKNRRSCDAFLA